MEKMICKVCLLEKEDKLFYGHAGMSTGRTKTCIDCTKARVKKREELLKLDPEWREKEKARHREKYYRLGYKEKHKPTPERKREIMEKYKTKYPEKYRAINATQRINPIIHGNHLHHWSYNQKHWRDVIELSVQHHALLHRHIIYDQERMMYRSVKTGILLDTKESHIELLNTLTNA